MQVKIVRVGVELGAQHSVVIVSKRNSRGELAYQLAHELALVHAILERFAAIDKDDRDFVVELTAQLGGSVDVNLAPGEAATARELNKALFDHFAQVASLSRIDNDAPQIWHAWQILARRYTVFQPESTLSDRMTQG
jgi:hypothetical protein